MRRYILAHGARLHHSDLVHYGDCVHYGACVHHAACDVYITMLQCLRTPTMSVLPTTAAATTLVKSIVCATTPVNTEVSAYIIVHARVHRGTSSAHVHHRP
eukprot:38709-Pyramimonas_sp.AAC.1